MHKKRGLGVGLTSLLSDIKAINTNSSGNAQPNGSSLQYLPLDKLKPGKYQPRRGMDQEALAELANSIRAQGIIQPIIVRQLISGNYEIIAGERRWRAAQLADLHEVPVVIREISDEQAIALSLIENIQREELSALDTAIGLQRLIDEFAMTHQSAASAVGKSRAAVTNFLRLLDLPDEIKDMLQRNQLEMGHARALLTLGLTQQLVVAKTVISKGLSVREAEILVRRLQNVRVATRKSIDPNITQIQKQISDKLATLVTVQHTKEGKGKVIIQYNSLDELKRILGRFL